jgi:hypothetical protein
LAAICISAGFVFVIVLIAGPGTGDPALTGLFASTPMPARPRGVQETDLAPFVFRDPQPVESTAVQVRAIERPMDPARAA